MANPDDIKNKAAQVRTNAGSDAKKAKTIQIIGGLVEYFPIINPHAKENNTNNSTITKSIILPLLALTNSEIFANIRIGIKFLRL